LDDARVTRDQDIEAFFGGRRLLVTGASGFLGTHLCSRLAAARADVNAVSRTPRVSAIENLSWRQADVEDLETARRLVGEVRPDVIYHLGGLVNGAPELKLVVPTFHSLVTSTVNLLEAAAQTRCRVVLVGSLEEPTGSSTDVCPASPYGAAKWAACAYGRMFHHLFGVPVVIARTYMTYGPGQPSWKVIPSTILSLLRGDVPRLSSGHRALDWVYVDDVVHGLLLAGIAPSVDGTTIDLGSGKLTPIRDVVARLVELVAPGARPVFDALPDRPRSAESAAEIAPARAMLDWTPRTSLDDGLAKTVEWYRSRHVPTAAETQRRVS
jgi:nucleoside-diphosphate-sugar epimerase